MADDQLPDELEDEFDESDLHFAAQDGDMTRVRQLIADGRSPNAFDELSKTPLHYAAENGHIDIMRVLLEAGADVNAHEEARSTGFARPEFQHLDRAVGPHLHIRRLQIPMDDPVFVSRLQRISHLHRSRRASVSCGSGRDQYASRDPRSRPAP
jgi:hypothetical protein